jgi:hypothetical protein
LLDETEEVSTCAVFKYHPEVVSSLVPVVKSEDVDVGKVVEDLDLEFEGEMEIYLVEDLLFARFFKTFYCDVLYALLFAALGRSE